MGIGYGPKIVLDKLVAAVDAADNFCYPGTGTTITNLVNVGTANTISYISYNSSSGYESGTFFGSHTGRSNISFNDTTIDPSSGGFTICAFVKTHLDQYGQGTEYFRYDLRSQTSLGFDANDSHWNYLFEFTNSGNTKKIEAGVIQNGFFTIKDDTSEIYYGEKVFTTVGQYTWTVPDGVTSITGVCVGGGGGGGGKNYSIELGYGGGGGGLAYGNWSVTPGDVLYIQVGAGGSGGLSRSDDMSTTAQYGGNGEDSYIKITSHAATGNDIRLVGYGGSGGASGSAGSAGETSGGGSAGLYNSNTGVGGTGGTGGGTEGGGGGGACGYDGSGGRGGNGGAFGTSSFAGAGGGGGGGGSSSGTSTVEATNYNSGGGVGIYGRGTNGAAGDHDAFPGGDSDTAGHGGSGGTDGSTTLDHQDGGGDVVANQYWLTGGGLYGGGGGAGLDGNNDTAPSEGSTHITSGRPGGQGAVRIVWSNSNTRQYPTTNVGDNTLPLKRVHRSLENTGWNFIVFGSTADYKTFTSFNGESKQIQSTATDWNTVSGVTLNNFFGRASDTNSAYRNNMACNVGQVLVYDKELSNAEILENYNVLKTRIHPDMEIVSDNLVLDVDANDGGGSIWTDQSGSGTNGTLSGSNAVFTLDYDWQGGQQYNGAWQKELRLGSSSYLSFSNSNLDFGTGPFAIEFWMKINDISLYPNGNAPKIMSFGVGNGARFEFYTDRFQSGSSDYHVQKVYISNGTNSLSSSTANYFHNLSSGINSKNTWYHICFTREETGGNMIGYFDGRRRNGFNNIAAQSDVFNGNLYFNTNSTNTNGYGNISLGLIRAYKGGSLTEAEVARHYQMQRRRFRK